MTPNSLDNARHFAAGAHAGQTYGSNRDPYTFHLSWVVSVLQRFGLGEDTNLLRAGLLHDTIEDTPVTYADLVVRFGRDVAVLVDAVTDRPGKNRAERHVNTYPNIRKYGGDQAVLLKLADRIANVEYSLDQNSTGKVRMYRSEMQTFEELVLNGAVVQADTTEGRMWAHLKKLLGTP